MADQRIRVGITQGDYNGIGLEVIIKTFMDPAVLELCTPVLFGSQKIFSFHRRMLNVEMRYNPLRSTERLDAKQLNLVSVFDDEITVEFGKSVSQAGKLAHLSLDAACQSLEKGEIDVLVTAPLNKHNIQSDSFQFKGHTDFLESKFKGKALMLMCANDLRVGVVTGHIPVSNVSALLNTEKIHEKIVMLHKTLCEDFRISNPRIAVLGLNPHAGDQGTIGGEEATVIVPAIEKAKNDGITVMGPYSADGFFADLPDGAMYQKFDATLAMYHDQGLVPFKTLAFDHGVNYSSGLPIVRTSPGHGVAYDLAGKNKASENSFRQAVYLACDIFRARSDFKEASANPLKAAKSERE